METESNFIIVGAGPTGLMAAIAAEKAGFKAIVLEKGKVAGPQTRGESFRGSPFLKDLLGNGFFTTKCFQMPGNSVYHSPGSKQQFRLEGKKPLYFFEWRSLIDRLLELADRPGIEIRLNSEVSGLIRNRSEIVEGVTYRDQAGASHSIKGCTVLACDGYRSTVGKSLGVDYDEFNCPMVKCLVENREYRFENRSDLHFYLIGNGDLSYAPLFPPTIAYMFPIGRYKMEVGIMLRMMQGRRIRKGMTIPDQRQLLTTWQELKQSYPGFSDYFTKATILLEEATGISNAKLAECMIPAPGVVLIGDAAGFVNPFGSSGLYSGMTMAESWVNLIAETIGLLPKDQRINGIATALWTANNCRELEKRFRSTPICKRLKLSYLMIDKLEWYLFRWLRTADHINRRWQLLSRIMQMAAKF
jgi:flavin-dependent dehydrogenase